MKKKREYASARERAEQTKPRNDNYHLREVESNLFCPRVIPVLLRRDIEARWLPRIKLSGYRIEAKQQVAKQCLHNLILAGLLGGAVADTRNAHKAEDRTRIKIWDAIKEAGLLTLCLGSEESGKQTRYQATEELLTSYEGWPASDLVMVTGERTVGMPKALRESLVFLQVDKEPQPFPPEDLQTMVAGIATLEYLKLTENEIEKINRVNLSHSWQSQRVITGVDGAPRTMTFQPSVEIRQIHSELIFRYARNYTGSPLSGQSLTKQQRRWMRIDGQKTTELDFSGCQTRMLYNLKGLNPKHARDIIRPQRVMRKFYSEPASDAHRAIIRGLVKRATNICWNTKSRRQAIEAVRKVIRDHAERNVLTQVMQVEQITAEGIIDGVVAAHPKLADSFFTEISAWLMTFDGQLMLKILREFARENKPALGIHDSVLCKAEDAAFARHWMRRRYRDRFGFFPVIQRVF